jgi:hypothetical protein
MKPKHVNKSPQQALLRKYQRLMTKMGVGLYPRDIDASAEPYVIRYAVRQGVGHRPLIYVPGISTNRHPLRSIIAVDRWPSDMNAMLMELAVHYSLNTYLSFPGLIPAAIGAWVDSIGPELDPVCDPIRVFQGISLYQFLLKKKLPQTPQPFAVRPLLMRSADLYLAYNMRIRAAEDCLRMAWINMTYGHKPWTKKIWRSTPGLISRGARYLRTDPSRDTDVEKLMAFWKKVKEYYRRLI